MGHVGFLAIASMGLLLGACTPSVFPEPLPPGRVEVAIESVDVLQLESFPVQLMLHVIGTLPNPCTTPEWDVSPDGETINVELYGVPDGSDACIQVLAPFEVNIPLGPAGGDVEIVLNGESITSLTLP